LAFNSGELSVNLDMFLEEGVHILDRPNDAHFVSWRRFGHGPDLLLLHGGHGSWLHWVRTIEPLAQRYTVWVPDMPGYGASSTPPENTLVSLTEILRVSFARFVSEQTSLVIVGFSFGGLVASQLAVLRSAITHLVLLGPAGHDGERRPRAELVNWRFAYKSGDEAALAAAMRHNLLNQMLHLEANADCLALHVHTQSCLQTRFQSRSISRSKALIPLLNQLDCAVTLVWGEHDVTAEPTKLQERLLANRANRNAHILPNAGHWVQYEAANQVNALLLAL
jgi:pimeloyl-ACP methyl ester carboxylesterase